MRLRLSHPAAHLASGARALSCRFGLRVGVWAGFWVAVLRSTVGWPSRSCGRWARPTALVVLRGMRRPRRAPGARRCRRVLPAVPVLVMCRTQVDQILKIGKSASFVLDNVMRFTSTRRHVATGDGASSLEHGKHETLHRRRDPTITPEVQPSRLGVVPDSRKHVGPFEQIDKFRRMQRRIGKQRCSKSLGIDRDNDRRSTRTSRANTTTSGQW